MKIQSLAIVIPFCHEHIKRLQNCIKTWVPLAESCGYEVLPVLTGTYNKSTMAYQMRAVFNHVLRTSEATHFARVDTDTYVWPERIKETSWDLCDYMGNHSDPPLTRPFMFHYATAPAYFLSRHAMELCTESPIMYDHLGKITPECADDRWVGRIMDENSIPLIRERRMVQGVQWDAKKYVMWHGFGTESGVKLGCPYL